MAVPQTWPANKVVLFQRGDPSSYLVAMEHGHIRISLQTRGGRELVLQHVRGAATVGEVGVLDGSTRTADATVAAQTSGYLIDRQSYTELCLQYPELTRAAIRHLCGLVRYTTDHIETVALYGLRARLARFLLASLVPGPGPSPALDLNQSEIADLLGSTRSKVNGALAELEAQGAIERVGKILTLQRDALMKIAATTGSE
jgi:CRP-like cAMP-binding protein